MSEVDKVLKMQFNHEELIQDDPIVQHLLAERELKGKAEGKIKAIKESILESSHRSFLFCLGNTSTTSYHTY